MFIRSKFLPRAFYQAEGGGGGTPPAPAPAPAAVEPKTYTADYMHGVREEAKSHRIRAQEAEAKLALAEKAAQDAAETVKTVTSASNARLIAAELRGAALAAGLVDLDALKLLDTSKITISDAGDVVIPDTFFTEAKAAKPYLFGTAAVVAPPTSNTSTGKPPAPGDNGPRKVSDMNEKEYAEAKRRLLAS